MIGEGGFERAILFCSLNKKHLVPTVPPVIALRNYKRSRTLSRFFSFLLKLFFFADFP